MAKQKIEKCSFPLVMESVVSERLVQIAHLTQAFSEQVRAFNIDRLNQGLPPIVELKMLPRELRPHHAHPPLIYATLAMKKIARELALRGTTSGEFTKTRERVSIWVPIRDTLLNGGFAELPEVGPVSLGQTATAPKLFDWVLSPAEACFLGNSKWRLNITFFTQARGGAVTTPQLAQRMLANDSAGRVRLVSGGLVSRKR